MANYMKDIAKMLGVELGETFEAEVNGNVVEAKITPNDICVLSGPECWANHNSSVLLRGLLRGHYTIRLKPWKPHYRQEYYSVGPGGVLEPGTWLNDFIDVVMYKLGNCYRTPQEAEANRDKWIAFYASDEVLEV